MGDEGAGIWRRAYQSLGPDGGSEASRLGRGANRAAIRVARGRRFVVAAGGIGRLIQLVEKQPVEEGETAAAGDAEEDQTGRNEPAGNVVEHDCKIS